ncbi:MAG: hypothetical protein ACLFV3_12975 [Phycisphaeraceae bacterium]
MGPRRRTTRPIRRRLKQLPPDRGRLAERLSLIVLALMASLLVMLVITPDGLPPPLPLFDLLWAAARKATFLPLLGLILAGPALTIWAMTVPGRHRGWLLAAWPTFLAIALHGWGDRLALMVRLIVRVGL